MLIKGVQFSGPHNPRLSFSRDFAAVYLVTDTIGRPIDIGQTESINQRLPSHDRKSCWFNTAYNGDPKLYVCLENSEQKRLEVEWRIRNSYMFTCGYR